MENKRGLLSVIAAILVIVLGAAVVAVAFYENSRASVLSTLEVITEQNQQLLMREVQHVASTLTDLSGYMQQGDTDLSERLARLRSVDQNNAFKRMGIITADGQAYTTDGQEFIARDRSYFKQSMAGEFAVSETLIDMVDGKEINVCSVPMRLSGKTAVLFATYRTEDYATLLSAPAFNDAGYSCVVQQDGTAVIPVQRESSIGDFDNLFERLRELDVGNKEMALELQDQMKQGAMGTTRFLQGEYFYISYQPLEVNDWYLLMIVPQRVAAEQSATMLALAYAFTVACAGAMILLMVHIVRLRDGNRRALEKLAYEDSVTGGATKARFDLEVARLQQKYSERQYAMVILNLEKFQYINDLFGYEEGDVALRSFGEALRQEMQAEECCARLQADQFVVFCLYTDQKQMFSRLTGLQETFNQEVRHARKQYKLKFNAGVSVMEPGLNINRLIDQANLALQQAKQDAIQQVLFFDEGMRMEKMLAKGIGDSFEQALTRQEFVVWFQPKYYVDRGGFYGAEALVRWQTGDGMISPADFIPVLEQNGGIRALDRFVFDSVCRMLAAWRAEGLPVGPISVNISRLHLYNEGFVQDYLSILKQYDLPPSFVQLELTETVIFDNEAVMQDVLGALREAGIRLEMDDFGAGYSSVKMMMSAPIDVVKLDKTMVDASNEVKGQHVLENIVRLAHTLDISVTAEGVETEEQFHYLIDEAGCDVIQGYYCRRPMPADEYEALLRESM